ncbi:baseplate assembly protein J [Bradyrhizobium phage BDU-MI-1]|nr:baseplate assembly protein J [Bradyrhizobium phage BDU-MI-1]
MPNYESPALYIDFARLPPPQVIEELDYEVMLSRYKADVLAKKPELAAALNLEQSPTNVILEAEAYGEMLVRARVNAAARAVMLAFSTGTDLDHLAALLNVERLPGELDESLRRRAQLAPEALSTAGSEGAYIFQALTADPTIRDVSAVKINEKGGVRITVMNSGSDPIPTKQQLLNVYERLNRKNIRPLTDVITVAPVKVLRVDIVANVTFYPGPDSALIMTDISKALTKVRDRISLIGRDLTRSALISALNQEGVQSVELISPAENIPASSEQCVLINSATITPIAKRAE